MSTFGKHWLEDEVSCVDIEHHEALKREGWYLVCIVGGTDRVVRLKARGERAALTEAARHLAGMRAVGRKTGAPPSRPRILHVRRLRSVKRPAGRRP